MKVLYLSRPLFWLAVVLVGAVGLSVSVADSARADDPFGSSSPEEEVDDNPFGPAKPAADKQAAEKKKAARVSTKPAVEQPVFWSGGTPKTTQRIELALDEQLRSGGLEFHEAPIEEVVDYLKAEYDLNIQIDQPALDEIGISTEDPITIQVRNVSLGSALRLMLKPWELTTLIEDEVLFITTEEQAASRLRVGIYPVGDLLNEETSLASIVDVLISTVASETWAENGGGEAEIRPLSPGLLVVSQTHTVHEELRRTLTAIRQASQAAEAVASPGAMRFSDEVSFNGRRSARTRGGGSFGGGEGGVDRGGSGAF